MQKKQARNAVLGPSTPQPHSTATSVLKHLGASHAALEGLTRFRGMLPPAKQCMLPPVKRWLASGVAVLVVVQLRVAPVLYWEHGRSSTSREVVGGVDPHA